MKADQSLDGGADVPGGWTPPLVRVCRLLRARLAPHRRSQQRRQAQEDHGPWGAQMHSPVLTTLLLPLGLLLASQVASSQVILGGAVFGGGALSKHVFACEGVGR